MKEILHEENVGQPGSGLDGLRDGGADEPGCVEIDRDKQEQVDGPDAQGAAAVEVAEVFFFVSGFEKDGGDQEAGEDEEEIDACPSPQAGVVDWSTDEAGMAVIEDDREDGEAAQAL